MTIEQSDKINGFVKFSLGDLVFHAYQDNTNASYCCTYWDASDQSRKTEENGLRLPTKSEATALIQSGVLQSDELRQFIVVGAANLLCWVSDGSAIESCSDTKEFKLRLNASGLGQTAPIWFVEVPDV